jgi:hypothetical protein
MPNRWITFVKKWSSENNVSYGCALTKPEMKAEYHKLYPKVVKTKGVAKLEESRPPADVKSKVTYPNLSIRIPSPREEQNNIQFEIEEMDDEPPKSKRGRPAKYMTEDEKYKAKLESNKQKRREKTAAKKEKKPEEQREKAIQEFNTMRDRVLDVIDHMFQKYKGKLGNKMTEMDWRTLQIYGELYWLEKIRVKYNDRTILRQHNISLRSSDPYKSDNWFQRINKDFVTYKKLTKEMLDYFISKTQVEFPPPDSDILPNLWIERHLSKKVRGGMISESDTQDAEHRGQIVHKGANIKNLLKEKGDAKEIKNEQYDLAAAAFLHLKALKKPNSQETAIMNAGKSGYEGTFMDSVMDLPSYYRNNNIPTIEPRYL